AGLDLGAQGNAVCHGVQPVRHRAAALQGGGAAKENEKGRLESVFGIGGRLQHPATHAQNHRPMPAHPCRECRPLAPNRKSLQQRAVALVLESLGPRKPVNVPDNDAEPTVHHGGILANDAYYLLTGTSAAVCYKLVGKKGSSRWERHHLKTSV